jgi:hypothetical protein
MIPCFVFGNLTFVYKKWFLFLVKISFAIDDFLTLKHNSKMNAKNIKKEMVKFVVIIDVNVFILLTQSLCKGQLGHACYNFYLKLYNLNTNILCSFLCIIFTYSCFLNLFNSFEVAFWQPLTFHLIFHSSVLMNGFTIMFKNISKTKNKSTYGKNNENEL